MIRPIPSGDNDKSFSHFLYSDKDIKQMMEEIKAFSEWNMKHGNAIFEGFVFGCLKIEEGNKQKFTIDEQAMSSLSDIVIQVSLKYSFPYRVTFHKAFDLVYNSEHALRVLMGLNNGFWEKTLGQYPLIDCVLTSGATGAINLGSKVCESSSHFDNLNRLIDMNSEIIIMPGGGVRTENAQEILLHCSRLTALHSSKIVQIEGKR
jgi:copper homeostasis protein CutC